MACSSIAGVHCGSAMMTTDAAWMFSPTPPAWIWLTSTKGSARGELVHHRLARGRWDAAGQRADRVRAERRGDHPQHVAEKREDHDLVTVGDRFLGDLDQAPKLG
jgi:hypothetical protein